MVKLLIQVLDGSVRVDAQLDLLFTNQGDLAGDVTLSGSLVGSDQKQRWLRA